MTDRQYLRQAYMMAEKSPDLSTQNGGVVVNNGRVIGRGCNRPPLGIAVTHERLTERPLKYKVINHAEDATLFNAVASGYGNELKGSTLYCPWVACSKCACVIIALQVSRVVCDARLAKQTYNHTNGWADDVLIGLSLLKEAGVIVDEINEPLYVNPVRFNSVLWTP